MYEARCRRCFEPNLATQKVDEEKASTVKVRAAVR